MSKPSKWLPSMEAIQTNAVFARLTRHSRWPSLRTTVRLFGAALLVGAGGAVALLVVGPTLTPATAELLGYVFILSGLAVVLLSPPVAALVTIITTVTDVQSEAYQLMRMSLLPKEEIVSGYIYAALYRLRLLWVLAFGLLSPPVVVILAGDILLDAHTGGIPIMVVLAAPAIWSIGVMEGIAANWVAACIAVWQALRKKRIEIAIITTLALLSVTGLLIPLAVSLALMGYVIPRLTDTIRKKAEGCI